VDLVGLTLEDFAAGGVTEDMDVRVLGRAKDARGDLLGGLVESGVDAGNDDIELRERVVFEVQSAVEQDIDLDTCKDAEGNCGFDRERFIFAQYGFVALPLRATAGCEFLRKQRGGLADA